LRSFCIAANFQPGAPSGLNLDKFYEFWLEASGQAQSLQQKELSNRKARLGKLMVARRKTWPVMKKLILNEISPKVAAAGFKRPVKDKQMLKEIWELWEKILRTTPEQHARQKKEIAREEVKLAGSERRFKRHKACCNHLSDLAKEVQAEDGEAAKTLAEIASMATQLLHLGQSCRPHLFRPIARSKNYWPVFASNSANWEKEATQQVNALELGMDLQVFNVPFRKARGADANLPARQWAKTAVRTIEETKIRYLAYGALRKDFGSDQAMIQFCVKAGWQIVGERPWVHEAVKLKSFSRDALPEWKQIVRKLIREEVPDFHLRPEWSTQRNTAEMNGRATPGQIKNAILDDITSALERLAPEPELPKPAC
jgi:hypothetical protein